MHACFFMNVQTKSTRSNTPPLISLPTDEGTHPGYSYNGYEGYGDSWKVRGEELMLRSERPNLKPQYSLRCNRCSKESPPIHNGMQLQLQKEPSYAHKEPVYHPPSHAPCSYTSDQPSAMAMAMAKAVVSATCEGEKVGAVSFHEMPKITTST